MTVHLDAELLADTHMLLSEGRLDITTAAGPGGVRPTTEGTARAASGMWIVDPGTTGPGATPWPGLTKDPEQQRQRSSE